MLFGGLPAWKDEGFSTSANKVPQTSTHLAELSEGELDSEEFIRIVTSQSSNTILLDVRTVEEFDQGIIPGAITIPADEINDRIAEIPLGKQIFIYCKSGVRAKMVYYILKEKGIPAKYLSKTVSINQDGFLIVQDS